MNLFFSAFQIHYNLIYPTGILKEPGGSFKIFSRLEKVFLILLACVCMLIKRKRLEEGNDST